MNKTYKTNMMVMQLGLTLKIATKKRILPNIMVNKSFNQMGANNMAG
jgi:hypothetical protein